MSTKPQATMLLKHYIRYIAREHLKTLPFVLVYQWEIILLLMNYIKWCPKCMRMIIGSVLRIYTSKEQLANFYDRYQACLTNEETLIILAKIK